MARKSKAVETRKSAKGVTIYFRGIGKISMI